MTFHEYPKAVYPTDGGHPVVVESAEHEAAILVLPAAMTEAIADQQEDEISHASPDDTPPVRRRGRPPKVVSA